MRAEEGSDPRLTETFLLSQPDVIDASVWFTQGRLHAHVTVHEESNWTRSGIHEVCAEVLGLGNAPSEITLHAARRRAA